MCHLRSGLWTADGADGQLHPPPMEFSNHALFLVKVVVVNLCFTSLFGTKGLLSDIVIR